LELTVVSVDQVKNQWNKAAEKLDLDQELPAVLVTRILEKARTVRESIYSEERVQKVLGQAKGHRQKLQQQMIQKALKAKDRTHRKVKQVKAQAQAAGEIVKNSPLKGRRKKSTTPV
jgi:hypothetical protein